MPLTRDFRLTMKERADHDAVFRKALLAEAVELLVANCLDDGKLMLRDYINATIGFKQLGKKLNRSAKNLMRSLSVTGNPTMSNLFEIIEALQKREGITLKVTSKSAAA